MRFTAVVAALVVLATPCVAPAQSRVPYVPTPQEVVERMLEMAKVGPYDYLIDLGSGDGRIVITAARKYGTRGFGVDLNPERVKEGNENARRAGVVDKVAFYQRDLFETHLADATVITMYLLPQVNLDLRPRLLELKPGTRLVSHDFDMGDWKADSYVTMDARAKFGGSDGYSDIYLWVVPAKVAGAWQWELAVSGKPLSYEVRLEQKYQVVTGTARVGGRSVPLTEARLHGDEIRFSFTAEVNGAPVRHELVGKVAGDAVHGSARLSGARMQGQHDWIAQRTPAAAGGEAATRAAQAAPVVLH